MKRIICISVVLILLLPVLSNAQSLPFVAAETDAVSLGRAGAGLADTGSSAYSSFSNAASIPFSDAKMDVAAGYTLWSPAYAKSNMLNVGAAFNLKDKFGVAVGFLYGMNPAYEITDANGVSKGQFNPSDIQMNIGLAWRFLPYMSLGANIGYAGSSLAEGHSHGAMIADVFAMASFSDFKVTAGIANLGSSVSSVSGKTFALPTSAAVGLGYGAVFAERHSIEAYLDADYYFSNCFAVAAGAGYTFNDLVSVRAGYRYGGAALVPSYASVGLGMKLVGARIDIAYILGSKTLGNTLTVGIGYSF